jgi:uncharacterized protein (TIGR02186 family)
MSRARQLIAALLLALAATAPATAEPLVADLDNHLIGITSAFTGATVVLFGATDGPGDIVVVVRGPDRDIVVRRKRQVAGVWVNTKEETFTNAPSFYSLASSRPLDAAVTPADLAFHQIGLDNLRLTTRRGALREEDTPFRNALVEEQQRENLYGRSVGRVDFLGERLFRTTIAFPSNVPTGTYSVQVFLVRNKKVVAGQTTPLVVSKIGLDARVFDFSDQHAELYGLIAVLTAMMAGWLASLPFRNA